MKHICSLILTYALVSPVAAIAGGTLSFTAASGESVITVEAASSSGLNEGIKVVQKTDGLRMSYSCSSPGQVKWYRFSALGGAYAEEVSSSGLDASSSWIDNPEGDMGYIVECGTEHSYLWLVDYSKHRLSVSSISESASQDCGYTSLDCAGSGDEIIYYSITGQRLTLSRDISVTYTSLEWNDEQQTYTETSMSESFEYLPSTIHVTAPLCATDFTIEGDRFLSQWGNSISYTSPVIQPRNVSAHTQATAEARDNDNETSTGDQSGGLGGSAPCTVTFKADVTDAAIFHEWQFSKYADFDDISMRGSEFELTYTFTEQGTTYVRLYCTNDDASCEYYSETYEISIGQSSLKCPNAFSPFNQDGINDVWKVSYSSIIEFECHIFNRNGHKIISLTDPSQGWDGRYGGKFVPAGAYYYVIKARGADGQDYNLSGDINILEYN